MADRYWVGGTDNWNATAGTKWATTSGGAGGAAVPTSSDDVFFDGASGAVTVTVTTSVNAKSLTFTGFTGTLAGSSTLNVYGSVIFDAGMTLTCTGLLAISATGSITSNGKIWQGSFFVSSSVTATFVDNFAALGNISSNGTPTLTGVGILITIGGANQAPAINTSCNFLFNGSGTWTASAWVGISGATLTINTSGSYTFSVNINFSGTYVFTHTAGTVNVGTTSASFIGTGTLNVAGITWYNFLSNGTASLTLGQDINVSNITTLGNAGQIITLNGNTIYTASLTKGGTSSIVNGTTNIILNGTGNWTDTTSIAGGYLSLNVTINTAGTITLVGNNHRYRTGTITYTSGTFNAGTSTFIINGATTLNLSAISFYNFSVENTTTITLSSALNVSNVFTSTGATTTSGAFNINTASLTATAAISGTASIIFNGTGIWSGAGVVSIPMEINTSGILTITGTVIKSVSSPIYTAGTVNTGTSTIQLNGSMTLSATLASITFYNLGLHAAVGNDTFILSSDIYVTNNIVITGAAANPKTSGIYNLYTGGLTLTSANFRTTEVSTSCATLIFNGTGTWSQASSSLDVQLNVTINTSGVLTLGTSIRTFTARFTYITGTVITTGNTWYFTSGELDTNVLAWNNVQSDSNGTTTLISDLNIAGNYTVATFTATINGLFNINIGGNLSCTSSGTLTGSATTKLVGTGVVTVGSSTIRTNLIIDTSGTITFSGTVSYRNGTFTYRRGKVIAGTATLNIILGCTLINIHKIVFGSVIVLGGQVVTMNEFFSGSANIRTRIASTNTTNYIITFLDGFEKITKFTKISNCTVTNRGQLLVITDKANANTAGAVNLGIRYNNTVPNGISKSNPSANLQACFGIDDGFCAEPLSK